MWIFTPEGFLSVVRNTRENEEDTLLVRARREAALSHLAEITHKVIIRTPDADYPYRLVVADTLFGEFLSQQARNIDYSNFKARVAKKNFFYEQALHDVWATMRAQEDSSSRIRFTEPLDPTRRVVAVEYLAFSTEDESLDSISGFERIEEVDGLRDAFSEFDEWRFTPLYELPADLAEPAS